MGKALYGRWLGAVGNIGVNMPSLRFALGLDFYKAIIFKVKGKCKGIFLKELPKIM